VTDAELTARTLSNELIAELRNADTIVIGAPMYNFSISTGLRAWFDYVLRAGETFSYSAAGPLGLLKGKRVIVIESRGGLYSEGPAKAIDFQEPYLRQLLGFMGLTDVAFIHAEKSLSDRTRVKPRSALRRERSVRLSPTSRLGPPDAILSKQHRHGRARCPTSPNSPAGPRPSPVRRRPRPQSCAAARRQGLCRIRDRLRARRSPRSEGGFGRRVSLTVCDITKPEAVKAWAAGVSEALGEPGLDLLISNAGILTPGPLEVLPLDAIRREFDVNVFGALSVMNAFLPTLRKARGRIVQVSTWTASVPLPFNGPSGASKAAMEVFATVYRAELKRFGVDVVVAAAGNMRTGGPAKTAAALERVADGMTPEQRELYGHTFASFATALNGMQNSGLDSVAAARRVIELAEQVPAPSRARWERTPKRCSGSFARNPTPSRILCASSSPA